MHEAHRVHSSEGLPRKCAPSMARRLAVLRERRRKDLQWPAPDTHLRVDSQGFLQGVPVLPHPQREVSVMLVHRGHPFPYLRGMDVALFHKAVRELDQKLHLLFRLLPQETTQHYWITSFLRPLCPKTPLLCPAAVGTSQLMTGFAWQLCHSAFGWPRPNYLNLSCPTSFSIHKIGILIASASESYCEL